MILEGQYPETWDEFVGQDKAKRQLQIAARSAKRRGALLGHTLLKSPYPGIGKTALALLATVEMDTQYIVVSGAMKLPEVRLLFSDLADGDVLIYEEMHKIVDSGKANAEWLLHYLENGVLVTPLGVEEVPKVTVIGTTTDAGRIPAPIHQRFTLTPELVPYSLEEGTAIAKNLGGKLLVPEGLPAPDDDTALQVAAAASNRPRIMRRLLSTVRDLAVVGEIEPGDDGKYDLTEALDFSGLTADGLPAEAQRYLTVMLTELRGQPAGAALMRERLGEVGTGLAEIEQLLLDKDLIAKTKQGRMLTAAGLKRTKALVAA